MIRSTELDILFDYVADNGTTLVAVVKEFPATWMIWEGEPMPATVEALGRKGIRSLTFDPCGNRPDTGDYLSVMRSNVKNLEKAFTEIVN